MSLGLRFHTKQFVLSKLLLLLMLASGTIRRANIFVNNLVHGQYTNGRAEITKQGRSLLH